MSKYKIDAPDKELKKMVKHVMEHKSVPFWVKALVYTLSKRSGL